MSCKNQCGVDCVCVCVGGGVTDLWPVAGWPQLDLSVQGRGSYVSIGGTVCLCVCVVGGDWPVTRGWLTTAWPLHPGPRTLCVDRRDCVCVWGGGVWLTCDPWLADHSLTSPSRAADAMCRPEGLYATSRTAVMCPRNTCQDSILGYAFQIFISYIFCLPCIWHFNTFTILDKFFWQIKEYSIYSIRIKIQSSLNRFFITKVQSLLNFIYKFNLFLYLPASVTFSTNWRWLITAGRLASFLIKMVWIFAFLWDRVGLAQSVACPPLAR